MATNIKEIGSYIIASEDGYLFSDLKEENVQQKWFIPSKIGAEVIMSIIGKDFVSVYLRGSVADGRAIDYVSDIDLFVLTVENISDEVKKDIGVKLRSLLPSYPFVTHFDVSFYKEDTIYDVKERTLIKLRSFRLFGKEVLKNIPDPVVGKDVAVTLPGLAAELSKLENDLDKGEYDEKNSAVTCRWMAKRIVRAGMELVSERKKAYTRDLGKCWEAFSEYYPSEKENIRNVLILAISPTNKISDLYILVSRGKNMVELAKRDSGLNI